MRAALVAAGLIAVVIIAIPVYSSIKVSSSQAAVRAHDLDTALGDAQDAAGIQPYAATPKLQQALVLELQNKLAAAIAAEREATRAESTNWRTWFVLSRLEAEKGNAGAAVAAYKRARALNPRSPIFAR